MESAHCQLLSWHYCTFSHFTDKQILWKLKTMFSQILDNELIIKRVMVPSQVLLKVLPKKKWFGIRRKFLKLLGNWKMDKAMLKLRSIITKDWLKKCYPPEILWQFFFLRNVIFVIAIWVATSLIFKICVIWKMSDLWWTVLALIIVIVFFEKDYGCRLALLLLVSRTCY